ncbi:MAG: hypothetical protein GC185_08680 [Alphaproteobacteria bacterium]|nr:hypothetical protein [Alphaproteobacteria bacterium]
MSFFFKKREPLTVDSALEIVGDCSFKGKGFGERHWLKAAMRFLEERSELPGVCYDLPHSQLALIFNLRDGQNPNPPREGPPDISKLPVPPPKLY